MKILYIEDNPFDAALTARALKLSMPTSKLDIVNTFNDAVAKLDESSAYDIIITDLSLPDGNGLELLTLTRSRNLTSAFLIVTGRSDDEVATAALKAGADDYIVKKGDYLTSLSFTINAALARHLAESARRTRPIHALYAEHDLRTAEETQHHLKDYAPNIRLTLALTAADLNAHITALSDLSKFDVIILNYSLPGISTLDLLKEIDEKSKSKIPVIMIAGSEAQDVVMSAIKLGAADIVVQNPGYLMKLPLVIENAFNRIQLILERDILDRREAILSAVAFAAEEFLRGAWRENISTVLRKLGEASHVSRAYIFERDISKGPISVSLKYEWVSGKTEPQIDNSVLKSFDLEGNGFSRWIDTFSRGKPIYGIIENEFPEFEKPLLKSQDILSLACFPITLNQEWWGFLGFDDCFEKRGWQTAEIEALRAAANIISAAIQREHTEQEVQRQIKELIVLHAVSVICTQASFVNELLAEVTNVIGEYLYPDNFGAILFDEKDRTLFPHSSYRCIDEDSKKIRFPITQGLSGLAFTTGQSQRIGNVHKNKNYLDVIPGVTSELCAPIKTPDRVLGILNAESAEEDFFTEDDERLMMTIASQIAIAIEKIQLLETERKQRHEAETLNQAAAIVSTSLELDKVLDTILTAVQRVVPYDSAIIFLSDARENRIVASKGLPADQLDQHEEIATRKLEQIFEQIRQTRQISILATDSESSKSELIDIQGVETRSWMGVPLMARGEVIGFLTLAESKPRMYDQNTSFLAQTFAHQAAAAISNARLFDETSKQLREMEIINRISTVLRASNDINDMVPSLLNEMLSIINCDTGAIWLGNSTSTEIEQAAAVGWVSNLPKKKLRLGEGLPGKAFAEGKLTQKKNLALDPDVAQENRSSIPISWNGSSIPIKAADKVIGVLSVLTPSPRELTDREHNLLTTIAEIAGNAIQRAILNLQTIQQLQRMTALRDVDIAISSSFDLRITLDILLKHTINQTGADAADILLFNSHMQILHYSSGKGFRSSAVTNTRFQLGESLPGRVALSRQKILSHPIETGPKDIGKELAVENFLTYYGFPLIAKGQIKGVLDLYYRKPSSIEEDHVAFAEAMAGQAAIAIDNSQLFTNLQKSNMELALAYDTTLEGWGKALELRDQETGGHTLRVAEITVKLAQRLGISGQELINIRRGALLHDIGKMGVPDNILLKPGILTPDEREIMKQHAQNAYDMLRDIDYLHDALDIPYCHHERWDGAGYPRRLAGNHIPKSARIFAVIDVWDALSSDRPYREAWERGKVIDHIKQGSGSHFDPEVVDVFLDMVKNQEI